LVTINIYLEVVQQSHTPSLQSFASGSITARIQPPKSTSSWSLSKKTTTPATRCNLPCRRPLAT